MDLSQSTNNSSYVLNNGTTNLEAKSSSAENVEHPLEADIDIQEDVELETSIEEHNVENQPNTDFEASLEVSESHDHGTTEIELVPDTVIVETSSLEKSCSAVEHGDTNSVDVTMQTKSVIKSAVSSSSKLAEEPAAQTSNITASSLKDTLRRLISDLDQAVLSKQDVYEFEDMFMDAKRKLYDAELRGRSSAEL